MDCERSNITILVVDHDEESLAFVAKTLMERQYKVETAKNAHDALVTLRNNEGLFDIIVTEFHVLGMDGFGFQRHIQDQFQIPVIIWHLKFLIIRPRELILVVMSKDNRQHLISMTLEKGATHFIVKPVCAEDFKDISMYVVEAKKHKLFIDNLFVQSEEQESSEQAKTKKEDSKRKNIDESQGEAKCKLVKKSSRLVWTDDLHNLFLDAIKKVGLKKAVPGKILELMNIPNLTRDNVASHLQKYRSFLDKVAEKELVGNASQRAFRSRFASNIPTSIIEEIKEMRTNIFEVPTLYQIGNCYFNHMNHGEKNWNCKYLNCSNIGSCVLNESPLSVNQNSMQMNENNDASAFLKSDLINSIQDVQSLDQLYKGGDDTSLVGNTSCVLNESPLSVNQTSMQFYKGGDVIASSSAEINSCMLNESPISLDQNSNQLQGYEQYSNEELYDMFVGDKMSEASTSATNPKSDMDLFEAVFGTTSQNNNFKFI
ncbi:unnamed protein product [Trifolium pratense]|uniref:Uncharacterized protein n=1 Tax=Trifolium pratense TaxID=57577 RepID=A0ACB0LZW0_TRIPR|nr:unnamed protein product [Trifolium pratense]